MRIVLRKFHKFQKKFQIWHGRLGKLNESQIESKGQTFPQSTADFIPKLETFTYAGDAFKDRYFNERHVSLAM